jgi:outer membrane immunogenic protein
LWTGDRSTSASKKECEREWEKKDKKWFLTSWDCGDWKETKDVKFEDDGDDVTFIGGVHLGYNYQIDHTVIGIEGDVSFADGVDYLGTLRGRLGYARGDMLLYATAGVAFAGLNDGNLNFTLGHNSFSLEDEDDRRIGFVVGGGVEYKLRSNLSLGLEGLYYAFSDESTEYTSDWAYGCKGMCKKKYSVSEDEDNDLWTVRARLTYHFADEAAETPLK